MVGPSAHRRVDSARSDRLRVADFTAAYTLDWANEEKMLGDAPRLREYLETMYARPTAPPTIAEAFAADVPAEQGKP